MNTNKIDLIKAEIEKLHGNPYYMMAVKDVLAIIDSIQEPASEDLEEAANNAVISVIPSFGQKNSDGSYVSSYRDCFKREEFINLFIAGAKWQRQKDEHLIWQTSTANYEKGIEEGKQQMMKNIWKPADGDDLPEIDREVIALLDNGKVLFAHRPPEYWDGKDIITGEVTRNYPKTYDKGGWNIPNVKYWLNVELPKEIEL